MNDYLVPVGHRGARGGFHVVGTAVGNLCVWITLLRETSVCGGSALYSGVGREMTVKKQFTPWMKSQGVSSRQDGLLGF